MSKKLYVSSSAMRQMSQMGRGSFYSAHDQEDIEKWLSHIDAGRWDTSFTEVFYGYWDDNECWEKLEEFNLNFEESDYDEEEGRCEHDEEIQKFIDEESKRERENQIKTLTNQSERLSSGFESLKKQVKENFESFKKLVDTDDYENLPEDEKKIYLNLKDLISL